MTLKTKRNIAIGGGTVLCAALAVLITMRFAPDNKPTADSTPTSTSNSSSSSQVVVEMSATKHEETNLQDNSSVSSQLENDEPKTDEPEKDNADENSITEVVQNFPEPEKENVPPAPPKIEDEKTLTNPDKKPAYEPEQAKPQQTTSSDSATSSSTPKHGDKKDGKIYINGFGWVDDEGGGGIGESAPDMFENGNKIGCFG